MSSEHVPWRMPVGLHGLTIFTQSLLPVVAVVLALETNWLVAPFLSFLPPFLTFLAAIMITAWYGWFSSAIAATVLSSLIINYYFIPPLYSLNLKPADWGTVGFFAFQAMVMAYCIDYLRTNEEHLHRLNLDLEHQMNSAHQ